MFCSQHNFEIFECITDKYGNFKKVNFILQEPIPTSVEQDLVTVFVTVCFK